MDRKRAGWLVTAFLAAYFLPVHSERVRSGAAQALIMLHEYAREHVLTCLVPAFFIAGAIAVFISREAVLRYFGAGAKRWLAYGVASVSGTVLAVCSCTVLPLFAGLYTRGAGIGPATAFLYSGPAINVLAIILTARVLGAPLGIARAVGAVLFALVIGLVMERLFPDPGNGPQADFGSERGELRRTGAQSIAYFATMVLILVFLAWAKPREPGGLWAAIYAVHWYLAAALGGLLAWMVMRWFTPSERREWVRATGEFAGLIFPLLLAGVLAAGFLMGAPGQDNGLIPSAWIARWVGGNSLTANFMAALVSAFMYFATLTEVPILQGLLGSGMGQGPALAMLLAGPALSLPNMLVIRSILGTKRTIVYVTLVVVMATATGMAYGALAPTLGG